MDVTVTPFSDEPQIQATSDQLSNNAAALSIIKLTDAGYDLAGMDVKQSIYERLPKVLTSST
jgi:hypothetical protein